MSIRRCILLLALMGVGLLWIPGRSIDADDWLPIKPEDLKMTSEPNAPGAPAIYLFRQVDRDDSSQATTEKNYIRIKILTEEGRKYGNVEIPFAKGMYTVSNIRARTIRPDGTITNFDGKVYENTVVKSKDLKILAKTFTMPDVAVGSIIEYRYNYDYDDRYFFSSHWILSEELFTRQAQFSLKPYNRNGVLVTWISPAGLPKGSEGAKEGKDGIIRLSADNIPAFQTEDLMPPENELKMRVDFIYRDSMPEKDVEKYWNNWGKKENERVESFIDKRKAMEQAVSQIVSPGDSGAVKLQKIYARTQQIRNLTYQVSKTEQEEKREKLKSLNNVAEVWKNGYGESGDITWLFLALARAAGFEAYPCRVSSRAEYFFGKDRMNSAELGRDVVLVNLNGKPMYFDPGAQFVPFNQLPWIETAVPGLKLTKDGVSWIVTTLPDSSVTQITRSADLRLTDEGTVEGKLRITFTGLEAQYRRVEERNEDETERKKYLEDQVKELIPMGSEVELTNKPSWNSSENALVAEFQIKVPGWASGAGRKVLLPVGLFSAGEKHMFDHAERVHAVYFSFPYLKIDDLKIELPLEWHVGTVPKPFVQDLKAAAFTLKVENEKDTLHIQRELRSDLLMVPQNLYPTLRSFYQIVRTQDDQQIMLQTGSFSSH